MNRMDQLQRLFPEAFVDGRLDLEQLAKLCEQEQRTTTGSLRQSGLWWKGKEQAYQESQTPSLCRWEVQEATPGAEPLHTLIVGDNLDALKLMQSDYHERVSMIYIDPPYNTGQTFSYRDNYRKLKSQSRTKPGSQVPPHQRAGEEFQRRHGAWLSMMYPRLILAHQLLAPTGVMFVSLDDNEHHSLRFLMDEIFGEDNLVANVIWRKKVVRGRGATHILPQTENILVYAKDLSQLPAFSEPLTEKMRKEYRFEDDKGPYKLIPLAKSGTAHSPRPNLVYPIEAPDGTMIPCPTHQWRWSQETLAAKRDQIVFRKGRDKKWRVFTKQYMTLNGKDRRRTPTSYYDSYTTTHGTQDMKALFGEVVLDFPKPVGLLEDLLIWVTGESKKQEHIILDFFAGSGTMGEAVLRLNQADGGSRSCMLVQIPAPTPIKSAAHRAGYTTVANVCQERLRRVEEDLAPAQPSSFRCVHLTQI